MTIQLSDQSIYDQTVRHLRSMAGPSRMGLSSDDSTACAYRGAEGRRCAVGFWIDDDKYTADFEGDALPGPTQIAAQRHTSRVVMALRFYPTEVQLRLLKRLQEIHDDPYHISRWDLSLLRDNLKFLAIKHGLLPAVLEEFSW